MIRILLADDHALKAVAFGPDGFLPTLSDGAVHISLSTISVALSRGSDAVAERCRLITDHPRRAFVELGTARRTAWSSTSPLPSTRRRWRRPGRAGSCRCPA